MVTFNLNNCSFNFFSNLFFKFLKTMISVFFSNDAWHSSASCRSSASCHSGASCPPSHSIDVLQAEVNCGIAPFGVPFHDCVPRNDVFYADAPIAVYHGTSAKHWESIKAHGILPSSTGMFGAGTYCGPPQKAARFAVFDTHTYEKREDALIVRALVSPKHPIKLKGPRRHPCTCGSVACLSKPLPVRCSVDHVGSWQSVGDMLIVKPFLAGSKYLLKTEEWVISPTTRLMPQCAARVESSDEHYVASKFKFRITSLLVA
jgi:hypothetical protein